MEQRDTGARRIHTTASGLERQDLQLYTTVQSEIAVSMKMALLTQHIQGDTRSHLLLTENLATPNFEDAARKVEEYYRNVYVDNNFGGVNGMEAKYNKCKGKDKKCKGDYRDYSQTGKGKGYAYDYQNYQKAKSKGKYTSRPYSVKGKGKSYKGYTSNYSRPKGSYNNYGRGRGKGKGAKGKSSYYDVPQLPSQNKGKLQKDQDNQKEKVPTLCATTVANKDIGATSFGGKDKHTSWINHHRFGQSPNDNQPQQFQQMPPQSSASTTIMTQPHQQQQTRLESLPLYETGSFHTAVNSINATLTINKENTTTDQLRRWAVLQLRVKGYRGHLALDYAEVK
eukprot:1270156-Amphidinium_carterae.1